MDKYFKEIKKIILKYFNSDVSIFIFGSALSGQNCNDIDVGVLGLGNNDAKLSLIREEFENSNIPYKIDLINFDEVEERFKEKVFKEKTL